MCGCLFGSAVSSTIILGTCTCKVNIIPAHPLHNNYNVFVASYQTSISELMPFSGIFMSSTLTTCFFALFNDMSLFLSEYFFTATTKNPFKKEQ